MNTIYSWQYIRIIWTPLPDHLNQNYLGKNVDMDTLKNIFWDLPLYMNF